MKIMTKNEIVNRILESLMNQRNDLNNELATLNHNETSFFDRKTTLEMAIMAIDTQVMSRVMDLELKTK